MDSRSRNEAAGDLTWLTNLRLLGLQASKVEITASMFDHPNPAAFHAIFFKLLELLNKELTNTELRDCWPVLDKKQEAEFRRKVVGLLKLYQKDHPEDLPYTNPSLFQSPGGRKFIIFLNKFTSFVVKTLVSKSEMIMHKPTVKRGFKQLRKKLLWNLTVKAEDSLAEAVEDQEEIQKIEMKAKTTGTQVLMIYSDYKKRLEELEQTTTETGEETSTESLELFDQKCQFVKTTFEELVSASREIKTSFDIIEYVSDEGVVKPVLNLLELPPSYLSSNLPTSFQSLLGTALLAAEKVLSAKTALPDINLDSAEVKMILANLQAVQEELVNNRGLAKVAVGKMLEESQKIDWTVHALSKSNFDSREALLPPTPSVMDNIKTRQEVEVGKGVSATIRNLQLFTPECKLATPSLRLAGGGGGMLTPVRGGPSAVLSRQFQLHKKVVTPTLANSPHLKPKAAFGEMSRLGEESTLGNTTARSTGSIGEFTPDMCSTVAGTFSELAESAKLDTTQTKIEMYKKVLDGLKTKTQDKSLLTAWNSHRNSLSPRAERSRMIPRTLLAPTSPEKQEEEEEELGLFPAAGRSQLTPVVSRETSPSRIDMLASRLDQLMTSLTLNDSNGPSFLNVSQEEADLLSPNLV